MSSAPKYLPHYTVADYRQWDGDWELWSGVPVAMTPSPFGRHQWIAGNVLVQLRNALAEAGGRDCYVLGETDWVVADDTVVRPDVSVVCGDFPEHHIDAAPVLVAEVLSPSTTAKDRGPKRELYQQQGVANYLILDPAAEKLELYRLTHTGHYSEADPTEPLAIGQNCQIHLDPTKLFKPTP